MAVVAMPVTRVREDEQFYETQYNDGLAEDLKHSAK